MNTTQTGLARHLRSLVAKQASSVLSDQQLLETFLTQRSEASFTALVQRHGPMVLSVCRRVLHNSHDAEDAFQATFLILARKAASIRKRESVSSWLHGVAYHTAEKLKLAAARRMVRERHRESRALDDPMEDITWRELRSVLDEELAKLPEQYRAPLVLCYLEGKTQDEAARQLGWSKGTFRRRLEGARDLLGRRLTRRGLALSAALAAPLLSELSAPAAVPAALAGSTIRASVRMTLGEAMTGQVSGRVAALAEGIAPTLGAAKLKVIAVLVLTASLGAGGLLAHQALRAGDARPPAVETPAAAPKSSAASRRPAPPTTTPEEAVAVRGRVLGPDGKPIAGAKVYVSTYNHKDKTDPKVRAQTAADGRFHFAVSRAEVDRGEMVAAVASGYGPDWVSLREADAGDLTLRLVKDDVPIKGRVLDLEGRPIAGATIRVVRVRKMPDEDLTPWLKELQAKPQDRNAIGDVGVKYERILSSVWGILGSPKSVKTGADGRFQFHGFGRERVVQLCIEGPGIEYRTLTVMTRPGLAKGLPQNMQGATFDHLAAPNKPIRGIVREKGTGKPLPGIRVGCQAAPGEEGTDAYTDKDGHYEILGIRKSFQYILNVGYRNPPFINYSKDIGDTPGLGAITADFELERALVVRVRVREKGTGKPVAGLVAYAIAADNANLKNYTTYPLNTARWDVTEKDGSYDLVALPGRGFIAIRAHEDRFMRARVQGQQEDALFLTNTASFPLQLFMYHAVVPIHPSPDDPKSLVCDIVLDPGKSVSGVVVGPDDRPMTGVGATGLGSLHPLSSEPELRTGQFTIGGLEPGKPRIVVFWNEKQGLARAVAVRGDEKSPLKIHLESRGTVSGQVVDAAGRPLRGIEVLPQLSDKQDAALPLSLTILGAGSLRDAVLPPHVFTDAEGKFRVEGFIAGLKYDLGLGQGKKLFGRLRKGIGIQSDRVIDVGVIETAATGGQDAAGKKP